MVSSGEAMGCPQVLQRPGPHRKRTDLWPGGVSGGAKRGRRRLGGDMFRDFKRDATHQRWLGSPPTKPPEIRGKCGKIIENPI